MQTVKQLQACPHRGTSICFSHELSVPSGDACTHIIWTGGDRDRLRCMTLGNARCQRFVRFRSTGDIRKAAGADNLLWLTMNHTFENQSLLRGGVCIASRRMPTGLTTSKDIPDLAAY